MTGPVEDLVVLPRRVARQPVPGLWPDGDCGACVLAGLLGMPIGDVYQHLHPKGAPEPFTRYTLSEALRRAKWTLRRVDKFIDAMPFWPGHYGMRAWGEAGWMQSMPWYDYLALAFAAGFYAIAQVDVFKRGPSGGGVNHWVMLCGSRLAWNEERTSGVFEVLVSCSSTKTPDEEWVEVGTFLKERGGFDVVLVKPA